MSAYNGILYLYHRPFVADASTVREHIDSIPLYSRFQVWPLNTECGFPDFLRQAKFSVIVLHWSVLGADAHLMDPAFNQFLANQPDAYKIALFQDEFHGCPHRFDFLNRYRVDCVFTTLDAVEAAKVYGVHTKVPRVVPTLTGYVSDPLVSKCAEFSRDDRDRTLDIGYRGRELPFFVGKGGREKYEIAIEFQRRAADSGLSLDIDCTEESRIYGDDWYRFLGNARGVLGVESGVNIWDFDGSCKRRYYELLAERPTITFDEMWAEVLHEYEGQINNRCIGPRHFEAAASRSCQILFEGGYSGILEPMRHYIPLKKDFSNLDETLERFRNESLRRELTENTFNDVIASNRYTYERFAREFDAVLLDAGLRPECPPMDNQFVMLRLYNDRLEQKEQRLQQVEYERAVLLAREERRLLSRCLWLILRAMHLDNPVSKAARNTLFPLYRTLRGNRPSA